MGVHSGTRTPCGVTVVAGLGAGGRWAGTRANEVAVELGPSTVRSTGGFGGGFVRGCMRRPYDAVPGAVCAAYTSHVPRGDGRLTHEVDPDDRRPQDQCGVFGVWAPGEDVAKLAYFGLYAINHRCQE